MYYLTQALALQMQCFEYSMMTQKKLLIDLNHVINYNKADNTQLVVSVFNRKIMEMITTAPIRVVILKNILKIYQKQETYGIID